MVVGLAVFEFHIAGALSLKDKRRVLSSLLSRLRSRFNVSVAEIGDQDVKQRATVALAVVSNSSSHADSMLSNVANFIENHAGLEIIRVNTQLL